MKKTLNLYDELIFSNKDSYNQIAALKKEGKIKQIASGIYTSKINADATEIIKRNIYPILTNKFSGCLISHRSAFELRPFQDTLFITGKYNNIYKLPGLNIIMNKGHVPIVNDHYLMGFYYSSDARAFLENLQITKSTPPKCLSQSEIEIKLDKYLLNYGVDGLNKLRDNAKQISEQLNLKKEFERFNKIVGALQSTKPISILKSNVGQARALSTPYDKDRFDRFGILFDALNKEYFKSIPDKNNSSKQYDLFAFFESYFSNYIEGTKFTVEDAKQIIDSGIPMPSKEEDSHDIIGTFKIVSNKDLLSITPKTADEFIKLLLERHKILLRNRPNVNAGFFKEMNNQAGDTVFVHPDLVKGTLTKGFEYYLALREPMQKAAYIKYLISEIHPFNDGNGRISRIFLNAELTKAGENKIIITSNFRENYIQAIKMLTHNNEPKAYIKMLNYAKNYSSNIVGTNFNDYNNILKEMKAFEETKGNLIDLNELNKTNPKKQ